MAVGTRGTRFKRRKVSGMLPDFRFLLGAVLAFSVIAVAGVGLVASARLVHEAHLAPIDDARSLAYAGRPEAPPRYIPPLVSRDEGASAAVVDEKPKPAEPPLADPPPSMEAASATTPIAPAPPAEPVAAARSESDAPSTAPTTDAQPVPARVASLPASPDTAVSDDAKAEPQSAADAPSESATPESAAPAPPARPKPRARRRIAHARFRSLAQPTQPAWQYPGFPPNNNGWPSTDTQFGPTNTKKLAGKLAPGNRPQ
jgi:hypothetical protein